MRVLVILLFLIFAACGTQQKIAEKSEGPVSPDKTIELWNGRDFSGWTFHLSDPAVPPDSVWTIGNGVLKCGGVPSGYIRTRQAYANYKLTVEWRWPAQPGNSGVLLHVQEPDTVWPKSIEGQLMSGNAGDIYVIGGAEIKEHNDPNSRRVPKRAQSSENEAGQWNRYEIYCKADSIRLVVNGVLQNIASQATLTSGRIALQSEGKPIEFRRVTLEPLD